MIINGQRKPCYSLYYIGGIILGILKLEPEKSIEEIIVQVQDREKVHVDYIYYSLDWLYLLGLIRMDKEIIYYDNKKINR